MRVPEGPGYEVSTHMLDSAARYLNDQAQALAGVRNSFNDLCYGVSKAFGSSPAAAAFNDFFSAWFSALDGQAETMGVLADATQQAATVYDHAARAPLGYIQAIPQPPPPQQPPPPGPYRPPMA